VGGTRGSSFAGLGLTGVVAAVAAVLALPAPSAATSPYGKNGRITYVLGGDIAIMAADGSGQTNLTNTATGESLPVFSPTGATILFWRIDGASSDIFGMGTDGLGQTNLTNTPNPTTEFASAFFPNGSRVAYSRDDGSQTDIWTMNPDGSDQRQLTDTPAAAEDEFVGDVSADGKRILFTRGPIGAGPRDVWVMNADGSGETNLTQTPGPVNESFASFSPNGTKIVYDRGSGGGQRDIWTASAAGANQRSLADTADGERNPVFSPSGKLILYARCGADCELYTMRLDGSEQTNLTETGATYESTPDWESIHTCAGRRATIVGDDGPDRINGTKKADVILGFGGKDTLIGRGGNDRLCGGKGRDRIRAGKGRDRCKGGPGRDLSVGCERGKL